LSYRPISPAALVRSVAADLPAGTVRVALDGPPCANPAALAGELAEFLRTSRPVAHVRAEMFWRDASLRFEHGHEDVESYRDWLDAGALRREVLARVASGSYLPSLRDPATNRSTRELPRAAPEGTVLIVSGTFLLGRGLPFDRSVHLAVSPAARRRQTPADEGWTLAALDDYDRDVRPADIADAVVRYDDPRRPALGLRSRSGLDFNRG
jgi:hypothetical protein